MSERLITAVMILALLVSFSFRALLLINKIFDPDEFQHLHNAWMLAHGFIPYRDFWRDHTPLLMVVLSPFARMFDESVLYLFVGRTVAFCASVAIFAMVFWLTRTVGNAHAQIFAIFLLGLELLFLRQTVEIRHDHMVVLAWLLGIGFHIHGRQRSSLRDHGLSGLSAGVGLLFSLKAIFAVASIGSALALAILTQRSRSKRYDSVRPLAIFIVAAALPLFILTLGMWLLGGATAMWRQVFVDILLYRPREASQYFMVGPHGLCMKSFKAAPIFWVCCASGLVLALSEVRTASNRDRIAAIVLSVSLFWAGLAFFVFVPPSPQSIIPLVTLLAIFGGRFGEWLPEAIARQRGAFLRGGLTIGIA
ncbi:MAG: glycosyltransferase family 39 protein, partial [candidate division NC10 bacterium]|nr:glycosyltransferase family 39 protein [candidate division NC10 bacterium]